MKTPGHRKVGWLQRINGQGSFLASIYVYVCQHTPQRPGGPSDVPRRILRFHSPQSFHLLQVWLYLGESCMHTFPTLPALSETFPTIGHRRISNDQGPDHMGECVDGYVHLSNNFSSRGKGKCQAALSDFLCVLEKHFFVLPQCSGVCLRNVLLRNHCSNLNEC